MLQPKYMLIMLDRSSATSTTTTKSPSSAYLITCSYRLLNLGISLLTMATGIEVAGLTLAIFPVLVDGLKHFKEGVETVRSWQSYRHDLANNFYTLKIARVFFLNTIEELLDGIIQSQEELEALRKNPYGIHSIKPLYEEQLRRRLEHDYDDHMETMRCLLEALQAM